MKKFKAWNDMIEMYVHSVNKQITVITENLDVKFKSRDNKFCQRNLFFSEVWI